MDLNKVNYFYSEFKKQLFENEFLKKTKTSVQLTGFSLSRFIFFDFISKLIESSNNRNKFYYKFGESEIFISYEDRKLIVITWTLLTFLSGSKPRIIYTPFTFFISSMLFWRELYNIKLAFHKSNSN